MGDKGVKTILKPGEILLIIGENETSFNQFEKDPAFTIFWSIERAEHAKELPDGTRFIILGKYKRSEELIRRVRGLALGVTIHYSKNSKDSRLVAQNLLTHAVRTIEPDNPKPTESAPDPIETAIHAGQGDEDEVLPSGQPPVLVEIPPPPEGTVPPADEGDGVDPNSADPDAERQTARRGQVKAFVCENADRVKDLPATQGATMLLPMAKEQGVSTTYWSLLTSLSQHRKQQRLGQGADADQGRNGKDRAIATVDPEMIERIEAFSREVLDIVAGNLRMGQELEASRQEKAKLAEENARLAEENALLGQQLSAIRSVLEGQTKAKPPALAAASGT